MAKVYIALGSNIDDPQKHIKDAIKDLSKIQKSKLIEVSQIYISNPVGPQDQPKFYNGVALIETELTPLKLLDELQEIEQKHHRKRIIHWGPRTLDLDILLYDLLEISNERLTIPHKEMYHRGFVMKPLQDIASSLMLPCGKTVEQITSTIDCSDLIPSNIDI